MPSLRTVENPASSNTTTYSPGVTAVKRYDPSVSVTADRVPICDGLVSVTVTPGITASDASVTRAVDGAGS